MFQQPKTRQEAEMLGMPKWQIDQMFPEEKQGGLLGQILGGGLREPPEMQAKIDHYAAMPVEPEDKRGFWQGGDKITGRDAVAGLLAGVGDGLQNYYGGDGNAMEYLQAGRLNAAEMAREKAAEQDKMQRLIAIGKANRMSEQEVMAQAMGLNLPKDDEFDRMASRAGVERGSPEYQAAARRKMEGDPFITTTLPDGRFYAGRASQLGGAFGGEDAMPTVEDGWRYTPGPGGRANQSNWTEQGGAASNGGGTFRRSY